MRSSDFIFIISLLTILVTDILLGYQFRQYLRKKWQISLYCCQALLFIVALFAFRFYINRLKGPEGYFWIEKIIGILFLFYVPKFTFILLNGLSLLSSKLNFLFSCSMKILAWGVSGLLFLLLLFSLTLGRYNYKIEIIPVPVKNLPMAFDGFKIIQLADLHLGSYGKSYKGISKLVKEVNALHPDLIVFTGDMVNNFADEMLPWIEELKKLEAPFGKYAVTGNHDYGDYTRWPSPKAKQENMQCFYKHMKEMGFHMLNNTNVPLIAQGDTLWLAGVENWGKPPFPRYGKLDKAIDSIRSQAPIVLLSHDPSHWRAEIAGYHTIPLTLSGHTHAMQMGIKIGNKEWSPAKYLYPEYDGLYNENNQYLYVSRGQGYLGFPGRIGLRPVITELILHPLQY